MTREKIYFWPQWWAESLPGSDRHKIKPALLKKLGLANLYLWRALNIYDDFLDGGGRPAYLPTANSCYRRYLEVYYRLRLPSRFYRLFNRVNSGLDDANRQELRRPRLLIRNGEIVLPPRLSGFPHLLDLSDKSLALGLGPAALAAILGKPVAGIDSTLNFFQHALAAKQLSDDARDWLDDLRGGAVTAANIGILKTARDQGLSLNLRRRPEIVYLLFAQNSDKLSSRLNNLCLATRRAWRQTGLNHHSPLLDNILKPIEDGLAETARFRALLRPNSKKML